MRPNYEENVNMGPKKCPEGQSLMNRLEGALFHLSDFKRDDKVHFKYLDGFKRKVLSFQE